MAECSDPPPPSDPSSSPKISSPEKTLDGSSPIAPVQDLVVTTSLALTSPIRGNHASSPAKSLTQIQNPDGSETLATPSSVNIQEESENKDMPCPQISPPNDNNNNNLQIRTTSDSHLYSRPDNRPPRRYLWNYDSLSDDDLTNDSSKPIFSWSFPKIEPTGVGAGLYNSGNTCFIASILQCFTHTVPLIESLRSYIPQNPCNCGNEKFCVMHNLRDHIEHALRKSGHSLDIDRFRCNLNHFSSDFMINHQEDAHEFLQSFLDKLERCCLDPRNKPGSISSQDVNIVDNVFGGRLMSTLHCCNCSFFSNTFEPSLGLSLEIEDVDNLWSALESFTRVEKLEDQFTCDNCKEKVSKEKQLKLDKLPPVATFHLKRFKNDGVYMEKIFKHVEFPLELDLSPYMSTNQDPEVSTKYNLYAFVEHIGSRATFGHYSSYVRSAPETWHNFDDSKVRKISEDSVLSQDAYILFYAREGTPWFSTTYEQLKPMFEATPLNFSPKSVLDFSYESAGNSNKASIESVKVSIPIVNSSDFRCHEPQEEVFHSGEFGSDDDSSTMIDALESPEADESEKPLAKTSPQREPESCPAGDRANIEDAYVPMLKAQNQHLSPKRKADERATVDDTYIPNFKMQKRDSLSKSQGSFQIQRQHLQTKNQEETRRTKPPAFRSKVAASAADPKDTKYALSYLNRYQTTRNRLLAKELVVSMKKNKRRSMGL